MKPEPAIAFNISCVSSFNQSDSDVKSTQSHHYKKHSCEPRKRIAVPVKSIESKMAQSPNEDC